MRVYEVMSKDVETVKPAVHASAAKTRMRQRQIHHLLDWIARQPEHVSNRALRKAREERGWETD